MKSLLIRLAIYGGIGLASWIFIWFAGYNSAKEHYLNQMKTEQARLEKSVEVYKRAFEVTLGNLDKKQAELDEEFRKNDEEAIKDVESTSSCISADGLRRLNKGFGHSNTP
jgi:hypothetical protein